MAIYPSRFPSARHTTVMWGHNVRHLPAGSRPFGVEIEGSLPRNTTPIGGYHNGVQVPFLPNGWKAQHDGSLHTSRQGYEPVEISSPKLWGERGVEQLKEALSALNERGFRVNRSCGVHISIYWEGSLPENLLKTVIRMTRRFEEGIYGATGTPNRKNRNWATPISRYPALDDAYLSMRRGRYFCLNIQHRNDQRRLEFRFFSGSSNFKKISGWVFLMLGIIEKALKEPNWGEGNWGPAIPNGKGRETLEALFQELKWEGTGTPIGVIGSPNLEEIKAELRRLADKYDSETAGIH